MENVPGFFIQLSAVFHDILINNFDVPVPKT